MRSFAKGFPFAPPQGVFPCTFSRSYFPAPSLSLCLSLSLSFSLAEFFSSAVPFAIFPKASLPGLLPCAPLHGFYLANYRSRFFVNPFAGGLSVSTFAGTSSLHFFARYMSVPSSGDGFFQAFSNRSFSHLLFRGVLYNCCFEVVFSARYFSGSIPSAGGFCMSSFAVALSVCCFSGLFSWAQLRSFSFAFFHLGLFGVLVCGVLTECSFTGDLPCALLR